MTVRVPAPALVAYDGSAEARSAVREAAVLLPGRPLVVATVWEAGLAAMPAIAPPEDMGMISAAPDRSEVIAVDRAMADHATRVAGEGAQLAREAGATAEPVALADELDPAETLIALADERDAAVIVVGSRGLAGLKARMHGSTTRKVMRHTSRPVLVIRTDD